MSCAYLTAGANIWLQDLIVACDAFECATLPGGALGLPDAPNPFHLPETTTVDVALVDVSWYKWVLRTDPGKLDAVFGRIEKFASIIIGIDAYDTFRLGAPPEMLDRCAAVLKGQGLYRDRDLYNYDVGPYFPGAQWVSKKRSSSRRYSAAQLAKLRLSLPCFVGVDPTVRARFRKVHPEIRRSALGLGKFVERIDQAWSGHYPGLFRRRSRNGTYFVGSLTHLQRFDLVIALQQAGIVGTFGLTDIPEYIFGVHEKGTTPIHTNQRSALEKELTRFGLMTDRRGRLRTLREMRRHSIVLGMTGYGELTFRHAEAWRAGAALLCQDLGHVEVQFPLTDGENALYCNPDLTDVVARIQELDGDSQLRMRIADEGQRRWREWIRDPDRLFYIGLVEPVTSVVDSASGTHRRVPAS